MRIIAGTHRGRRIASPEDKAIRPTHDRVRQSVFDRLPSIIGQLDEIDIIDVFAGTGAIGLEALSRGCRHAVFMDKDSKAIELITKNAASLDLTDRATIIRTDSANPRGHFYKAGLIYCDPPFASQELTEKAVLALDTAGWIAPEAWIVCERDRKTDAVRFEGFSPIRDDSYGRIAVSIWHRPHSMNSV